jgi:hypothetical protein
MTGRLAARAAEAAALLERFNRASEDALLALDGNDDAALQQALAVRDELHVEIDRVGREIAQIRARFANSRGSVIVNAAIARLVAPLEAVGAKALMLQTRLVERASVARSVLSNEIADLNALEAGAARYDPPPPSDAARLDVRL